MVYGISTELANGSGPSSKPPRAKKTVKKKAKAKKAVKKTAKKRGK
jgi:hypothetical protein